MTDMLVKLYDLPDLAPALDGQRCAGINIRRALAPEKYRVVGWVRKNFGENWAGECDVCFARLPISCFIAVEENALLGFACYDTGYKGIFGPTGVVESARGQGIGQALLLVCLHDMHAQGYAYAVIGWTGPKAFYAKTVGAIEIEDSRPGMYRGVLGESS
jgi:GNAT superfamily N-acetyltransferase